MHERETVFREWMHLFCKWMRLFRECMHLFRGSKSAHQLSVHVRWESKYTPLGTNNQSQQPYHQLFDLKNCPRLGQNIPWIQVEPARDCLWRHSTWWYSCRLYASRQAARWMKSGVVTLIACFFRYICDQKASMETTWEQSVTVTSQLLADGSCFYDVSIG